jgi:hypothetical protein
MGGVVPATRVVITSGVNMLRQRVRICRRWGMNMVEKDHPMNHQLREEDMNMVDRHMVEVVGMNMVEEH